MRRRLREAAGVALIVVAMLLAVALATWSVQDPSLSHATDAPVRNLLGVSGAIIADLLMQLFGIAVDRAGAADRDLGLAAADPSPLYREQLRAGGLGRWRCCWPRLSRPACRAPPAWPLPTGLGGVFGDALLRLSVLLGGDRVCWHRRAS